MTTLGIIYTCPSYANKICKNALSKNTLKYASMTDFNDKVSLGKMIAVHYLQTSSIVRNNFTWLTKIDVQNMFFDNFSLKAQADMLLNRWYT